MGQMGIAESGRPSLPAAAAPLSADKSERTSRLGRGSTQIALPSYSDLSADFVHGFIDHAERYVDGQIHTNGIENYWALLKRALHGTYVSVQPFHLFRYLDEEAFRFNTRKMLDAARMERLTRAVVGKRLTYKELIGLSLRDAT